MPPLDLFCLKSLWCDFFPLDNDGQVIAQQTTPSYFEKHERYPAIQAFKDFFESQCTCPNKHNLFQHTNTCLLHDMKKTPNLDTYNVEINLAHMASIFPYDDLISTLSSDPPEVIGCLNMAVSVLFWQFNTNTSNSPYPLPWPIFVRLIHLPGQMSSFSDLKANRCGNLLAIKGV